MRAAKRKRLEARGWKIGDAAEFLGLTQEEAAYLSLKMSLSDSLRSIRKENGWSQGDLANIIGSSQSRVAKMESGDRTVSLDLLVRSLLAVGASCGNIGRTIASGGNRADHKIPGAQQRAAKKGSGRRVARSRQSSTGT